MNRDIERQRDLWADRRREREQRAELRRERVIDSAMRILGRLVVWILATLLVASLVAKLFFGI